MNGITRRASLGALVVAGGVLGLGLAGGYLLRAAMQLRDGSAGGGMMSGTMMGGATSADMHLYSDLFNRHAEIHRTVEELPGGVRTITESGAPDLVSLLQAHVSSMYGHLQQGAEVTCMSNSLPTLFQNASGYRRQLTLTAKGVTVTETSTDPRLTSAIRQHAQEVSGFVRDGMPAMMHGMMGA